MIKRKKTPQFKETEKASEPDPDKAEMLKLSDQEFKTTKINMLRTPLEKVDSI